MRIIFLDVDGVLNSINTKDRLRGFIGIDEKCVKYLKDIIDATDAKIVLSSTWRLCRHGCEDELYQYLEKRLKEYNIEIMDWTPTSPVRYRGTEIQGWFKDNQDLDIESFIILDDDSDLKPYGRRHVQTSFYKAGLEQKHVTKAIKMLGEECKPWFEDIDLFFTDAAVEDYLAQNRQV